MKTLSWLRVVVVTLVAVAGLLLFSPPAWSLSLAEERSLELPITHFYHSPWVADSQAPEPDNAIIWNSRGYKLFRLGRFSEALVAYNHALLSNPHSSVILANRCATLSRLEQYTQALNSCNLALKGNSQWGVEGEALAWDNRGDVLFNLERYEESLASFERALKCNPNYLNAQWNRLIVLQKLEQPTELSSKEILGGI